MTSILNHILRKTTCLLPISMLFLCVSHISYASDEELNALRPSLGLEWVQVNDDKRHEVKTYIRHEENKPFRSFKAEILLNANLRTLANVLLDFSNYHKWYWRAHNVQLLKKLSATHYIIYLIHDTPYNLPDLDVILEAIVEPQTHTKNYLSIKVSALPNYLPERPPLKRMVAEDMSIRITPIAQDKTLLEVQGYFEVTNTILPIWAANMIQRSAPYTVCVQLKKMTMMPEYINQKPDLNFPIYEFEDK